MNRYLNVELYGGLEPNAIYGHLLKEAELLQKLAKMVEGERDVVV